MNYRLSQKSPAHGFALIITLVVIALLTVILVAFLTTASNDRLVSRVYLGREQAAAAARGAADEAMAVVKESFELYPDAATFWDPEQTAVTGGGFAEGTSLFIRATPQGTGPSRDPAQNTPNPANAGRQLYILPLTSGVPDNLPQAATARGSILPRLTLTGPDANATELNVPRTTSDNAGWIGSPPSHTGPKPKSYPAFWKEVKGPNNTVIARYAWWAEDDSFRFHTNLATDARRPDNTASTQVKPGEVNIATLFKSIGVTDAQTDASALVNRRGLYPGRVFPEPAPFGQVPALSGIQQDKLRFLTTNRSSSINATRHGSLRFEINTAGTAVAQTGVDQLAQTIGFHLPKFGQRFYRTTVLSNASYTSSQLNDEAMVTGSLTGGHAQRYFYKLAANIRDYLDTDLVPTRLSWGAGGRFVTASGRPTEHPGDGIPPTGLPPGHNPIIAQGKEAGLYIQEGAVKFTCAISGNRYELDIDYYVEIWNPSDKDIPAASLGGNPFVMISRPPGWNDNAGSPKIPDGANDPSRDIEIPISGTFPAGSLTVVTTDPNTAIPGNVIRGASGRRRFSGTFPAGGYLDLAFRSTTLSDYETTAFIGSDAGFIDGALGAIATYNNQAKIRFSSSGTIGPSGGTLVGNTMTASQMGDPRTNNEYIKSPTYQSGGFGTQNSNTPDQARYINSSANFPVTLGQFPGTNSVNPANTTPKLGWSDPYAMPPNNGATAAAAMSVVADGPMNSVGELGNVFDPARRRGSVPSTGGDIEASRGGARTLKIGQADDLIDPTPMSPSSEQWAAWRLCDLFTVQTGPVLAGTFNPNGLLRDDGTALMALLGGFEFQPTSSGNGATHGDAKTAGVAYDSMTTGGAFALRDELKVRLLRKSPGTPSNTDLGVTWGPIFERGEISELALWGRNATSDSRLTGSDSSRFFDRGREETFRRISEQICTRGNTYTVYAVGQAIQQSTPTARKIVTGTQRLRLTFRIKPNYPAAASANFDPTSPAAVQARFQRPTSYDVEILEVIPGL